MSLKDNSLENTVAFYDLKWDTEYFGIKCAKAILHEPLTLTQWDEVKEKFQDYQFVSIENRNSEPANAQLIGKDTKAFLVDVNIQFKKDLNGPCDKSCNTTIQHALVRNDEIIEISDFQYSKFTEDPELAKRGGVQVYKQWIINSFEKPGKYYALSKNENGKIIGFLLHSYSDNACIVELIAVSKNTAKAGIGTRLFKAVESEAYERGCVEIRVGTQVRNMGAINFYNKVGCKQVGCHQVYHLWNL